jgi:hypothetical protein
MKRTASFTEKPPSPPPLLQAPAPAAPAEATPMDGVTSSSLRTTTIKDEVDGLDLVVVESGDLPFKLLPLEEDIFEILLEARR